jgi:predicted benzoate:H+ symporter BenE
MEIAMRTAAHVVALALAALCMGLIAAVPIVAGWGTPTEPALLAPPINPLALREQAKHLQARQITDFSTID